MSKAIIILPAAGFGTRMGLLPHESKELLPDPYNDNKPLIDWHLDLVKDHDVVVVTREEKSDLIDHLYKDPETNVYVSLMSDVSKEWPATVLHSLLHWEEKNILLLPDTRFEPKDTVSKINEELETHDLVFAVHGVSDVSKWGMINISWSDQKVLGTIEKPDFEIIVPGFAWGIIGFKNHIGEELFTHYLNKTLFDLTPFKTCVIFLDKFADITRTGKIEQY